MKDIEGMTSEQELNYWKQKTQRLRESQQSLRERKESTPHMSTK